jgi:hypothetical protein
MSWSSWSQLFRNTFPAIVAAAVRLRPVSFRSRARPVVLGARGIAVFDALHRRGTVPEAILRAVDLSSSRRRTSGH